MSGLFKRLAASSAAYQAASMMSAALAVITLPLYTRNLTPSDYGYAETLLTFVIFTSILLRLGLGESLVRFWFDDEDPDRRRELARTAVGTTAALTSVAALAGVAVAGPLARALLGHDDAMLMDFGLLGLWAFTNLEVAYALLRVEERRRAYLLASAGNVALTVALTVSLVVVSGQGARGYVLGNYAASTVVLLVLWWTLRGRLAPTPGRTPRLTRALLAFGAPTVPADALVFLLNVVDRAYLLRSQSPGAAGVYAVAVKLSTGVILAVRGFQAAWPPLAYSVQDDAEAGRLYALVTTAYVVVVGTSVTAIVLLGRWLVRLLAAPEFFGAHRALPWLAIGWALYGLTLVFITIAGRAKQMSRNFWASGLGLVVNVVLLLALVGPLGIAGAGIALCGAYVVILVAIHLLTRRRFAVPFEWARLARVLTLLTAVGAGGELLLPTHGAVGLLTRVAALLLVPAGLWLGPVLTAQEKTRLLRLMPTGR